MFDKTILHLANQTPSTINSTNHTTIHEHRAPTDDSIRLADEMKYKVADSIVWTIRVEDNIINFWAVVFDLDYAKMEYLIKCKFNINWADMIIDINIGQWHYQSINHTERAKFIYKSICEKLSMLVLENFNEDKNGFHFIHD